MASDRPDPDRLLAEVQAEEAAQRRGRLRIYFGASAGVGKTFAMLAAARQLRDSGTEVVAGVVETHGRRETEALLDGIEVLPRRTVSVNGRSMNEFDLDAALARRLRCCWWTSWPTPTSRVPGTASAGRTSRSCWPRASTCTRRSTSSTSKA